jgi:toxin ParE1/3/4
MTSERTRAIRRSPKARADILEIWLYIAERNPAAADRVLDAIENICGLIAVQPLIGRERSEIAPGIRSFAVMSWVIFYRPDDEFIDIVRIVHGARDLGELEF